MSTRRCGGSRCAPSNCSFPAPGYLAATGRARCGSASSATRRSCSCATRSSRRWSWVPALAGMTKPASRGNAMAHWLLKSEPTKYSWERMVKDGRTHWDGVRNFQAANNLKAMQAGDHAFFYHSNEGKEVVGVVEIVRTFYPDPADPGGKFGMVDVAPVMPVKRAVTLTEMKA